MIAVMRLRTALLATTAGACAGGRCAARHADDAAREQLPLVNHAPELATAAQAPSREGDDLTLV